MDRMAKTGSLSWSHWLVLLASLVLTLFAWDFSRRQIEEKAGLGFDREARQVVDLIRERMKIYEDALWGGVSAIQANGRDISHYAWWTFAHSLRIDRRYPGINGIGIIHQVTPLDLPAYLARQQQTRPEFRIHPRHGNNEYWPITFIEPVGQNVQAVGWTSPTKRTGLRPRTRRGTAGRRG